MAMSVIERLRSGDFNKMNQEELSDGSKVITLSKRGDGKRYRMVVRDLYGPDEEVLWEEIEGD